MAAEVKLTMKAGDYQDLINLLRFEACKITEEQYRALLVSRGYRDPGNQKGMSQQTTFIAEQALLVLE